MIVVGALLFTIAVAIVIGAVNASKAESTALMRELDWRKREAQQQVRDIGQRTRAAILAEARRRQQGQP